MKTYKKNLALLRAVVTLQDKSTERPLRVSERSFRLRIICYWRMVRYRLRKAANM